MHLIIHAAIRDLVDALQSGELRDVDLSAMPDRLHRLIRDHPELVPAIDRFIVALLRQADAARSVRTNEPGATRSVEPGMIETSIDRETIDTNDVVPAQLDDHLISSLPVRYRTLAADVVRRLPVGWHGHTDWEIVAGDLESVGDVLLTGARLQEHGGMQRWTVRLDPHRLDVYSDDAVRWIIAHELARVACSLPSDPNLREDTFGDDRANHLALLWGFARERDAFETEEGQ